MEACTRDHGRELRAWLGPLWAARPQAPVTLMTRSHRLAVAARYLLAGLFIFAGVSKAASYNDFAADIARLLPAGQASVPPVLILLEIGTGWLLVSRLRRPAEVLSGLMICGFVVLSIVRWEYVAQGCSCFGSLGVFSGFTRHRALLTSMVALNSLAVIPEVSARQKRGALAVGACLTAATFLSLGLGYAPVNSLEVSQIEPNDTAHIRLELDQPTLIVRWDCPDCRLLLSALAKSSAPRRLLNVVFTYPEWLDDRAAEGSALSFSESLGLVGRPGLCLYLDHEFRFKTTPLLLVPVAGTTTSRVITSPNLKDVDRFSLASGT